MGLELKKRVLSFRNKVSVSAPEEVFDESVTVIRTVEEATQALAEEGMSTLLKIRGIPYENE